MSVYLMGLYADPSALKSFEAECKKAGKKLDMGKSCVRFKTLDDLPLKLIGKTIAAINVDAYIGYYEASRSGTTQ